MSFIGTRSIHLVDNRSVVAARVCTKKSMKKEKTLRRELKSMDVKARKSIELKGVRGYENGYEARRNNL